MPFQFTVVRNLCCTNSKLIANNCEKTGEKRCHRKKKECEGIYNFNAQKELIKRRQCAARILRDSLLRNDKFFLSRYSFISGQPLSQLSGLKLHRDKTNCLINWFVNAVGKNLECLGERGKGRARGVCE